MSNSDKQIVEEYKIWKKNTPFLYDLIITSALEWPSLTFQWFPDVTKAENPDYNIHRMIIGTHSVGEQNYLMLGKVMIPETNIAADSSKKDSEKPQYGGFGVSAGKFDIDIRICHNKEVNRARYMPQNPTVIATKSPDPNVNIFDYTKHPSKPDISKGCIPDLVLKGHTKEGYGLSWSHLREGRILTSSDDQTVCYWDINACPQSEKTLQAHSIFVGQNSVVEDVCWHTFHPDLFLSVGDDGRIILWDLRSPTKKYSQSIKGHEGEIYSIAMSPFSQHVLATGGSDKVVSLWDLRHMTEERAIHDLKQHTEQIIQIQWSPHSETMLASCSSDRRLNIWDIDRIGVDPSQEDLQDGPPELLFVHGGHTSKISDFCWNANESMMIGSVSDDNIIQFWKMMYVLESEEEEQENGKGDVAIETTPEITFNPLDANEPTLPPTKKPKYS